jgi:hypothetical protein
MKGKTRDRTLTLDGFIKKDNLTIYCQGATPISSIQRSVVWLMHDARLELPT